MYAFNRVKLFTGILCAVEIRLVRIYTTRRIKITCSELSY